MKILLNRAKCLLCHDIISSLHRHHYNTCSCGNLSVDGGTSYLRRLYGHAEYFEEMSETVEDGA